MINEMQKRDPNVPLAMASTAYRPEMELIIWKAFQGS